MTRYVCSNCGSSSVVIEGASSDQVQREPMKAIDARYTTGYCASCRPVNQEPLYKTPIRTLVREDLFDPSTIDARHQDKSDRAALRKVYNPSRLQMAGKVAPPTDEEAARARKLVQKYEEEREQRDVR